jgi:hypothetical protein
MVDPDPVIAKARGRVFADQDFTGIVDFLRHAVRIARLDEDMFRRLQIDEGNGVFERACEDNAAIGRHVGLQPSPLRLRQGCDGYG